MFVNQHFSPPLARGISFSGPLRLNPRCAAKLDDGAAPKRHPRKTAAKPAKPAPSTNTTTTPADLVDPSLHRLHSTSDNLRALLERRAERQRRQMATALTNTPTTTPTTATTTTAPITARPAAPLAPEPFLLRNTTKVRFWLPFRVEYGQHIVVVGSTPELGRWTLASALPLTWNDGDLWSATVEMAAGSVLEYKYVVVTQGGHALAWQQGNNSVLAIRQADDVLEVYDNWAGAPGAQVAAPGAAPVTRENKLLAWATELEAQVAGQRQELRRARMELVAAQEEAKLARDESKKLKLALAKSEAERIAAVGNLKQAETVNQLLQTQLVETTASFSQALEAAVDMLLSPAERRKKAAATAAAAAAKTIQSTSTPSSSSSPSTSVSSAPSTATASSASRSAATAATPSPPPPPPSAAAAAATTPSTAPTTPTTAVGGVKGNGTNGSSSTVLATDSPSSVSGKASSSSSSSSPSARR